MTHSPDDVVRAWVRSGPEVASAQLVERSLTPIPHMRQRSRWQVRLVGERSALPALGGMLAAAAAVVVLLATVVSTLPGIGGPGSSPTPSAPAEPTFELRVIGGPGAGSYESDPAALTNLCTRAADGSWRFIYGSAGDTVDLIIGAGAAEPGGHGQVAAEIEAGGGYVRFDPAVIRGGDPPGRSTATVSVEPLAGATRFDVVATTPDRTTGADGPPVQIELTVVCPG